MRNTDTVPVANPFPWQPNDTTTSGQPTLESEWLLIDFRFLSLSLFLSFAKGDLRARVPLTPFLPPPTPPFPTLIRISPSILQLLILGPRTKKEKRKELSSFLEGNICRQEVREVHSFCCVRSSV
ncbi:hypothetical protein CDAR_430071 [Caerostris darwini]|uniref:Uncharacterized protein n=1 Tax=Caerostris darwini TaxID=1538125 RepID=A0AAV4WG61_9ARAC|nr:hypothetical protein CDAR_430071 [Caerostris darwini]